MSLEIINTLSKQASELQQEIKLNKDVLTTIKKEDIYSHYTQIKKDSLALEEDFNNIIINETILQERKQITYRWLDEFYEEAIDRGIIHTLLKHGNKLKERFDLSRFELPSNKDAFNLGYIPAKKDVEEAKSYKFKFDLEKQQWQASTIEETVDKYMHLKKVTDLKERRYNSMKQDLLELMKEFNVKKTVEGFYLRTEPTTYNFADMYQVDELEETVVIATNGYQSVDLFFDKEVVEVDITEEDLEDIEYIKRRFGPKRITALSEVLGENFYYVKGTRKETNILNRFPVSTEKVEQAIDNGWMPNNVLKTGREIKSVDDIKLSFEVISTSSAKERAEINHQKFMDRALVQSGYYKN